MGETCDAVDVPNNTCTERCQPRLPACGDGFVAPGEQLCYGATAVQVPSAQPRFTAIAAGDFDGDRRQDIVAADDLGQFTFFKGQGNGTFTVPIDNVGFGGRVWGMGAFDALNDAHPDIIVNGTPCTDCVSRFHVDPTNTFSVVQQEPFPAWDANQFPPIPGGGDANLDGLADAAVSTVTDLPVGLYEISLFLNVGGNLQRMAPTQLSSGGQDFPIRVAIALDGTLPALWMVTSGSTVTGAPSAIHSHMINGSTVSPNPTRVLVQRIPDARNLGVELTTVPVAPGITELFVTATFVIGSPMQSLGTNSNIMFTWNMSGPVIGAQSVDADADGARDDAFVAAQNGNYQFGRIDLPTATLEPFGPFGSGIPCAQLFRAVTADFDGDGVPDVAWATDCGVWVALADP
jgi:hypothetical protein